MTTERLDSEVRMRRDYEHLMLLVEAIDNVAEQLEDLREDLEKQNRQLCEAIRDAGVSASFRSEL